MRSPRDTDDRSTAMAVGAVLLLLLLITPPAAGFAGSELRAQSLEDEIRSLVGANAEGYLSPLSDGLNFALTGGIFDSPSARDALSFDLSIRVLGAIPDASAREFLVALPDTVRWRSPQGTERLYTDPYQSADPDGSLRTPSALGEGPGLVLKPRGAFRDDLIAAGENPDDYRISMPEGLDLRAVPTAILGLSVGVGLGTEISLRYLPTVQVNSEVGKVGARGWGIQHTLSQWFSSPLDISAGIGRQEFQIGSLVDATASEGWLLMGRGIGPLTLFGTAGLRRSAVDVEYEVRNPEGLPGLPADGTTVRFRSDLDTTTALGAGFRLQLLFMNLSGVYTAGDFDTFAVKVGFGLP